MTLIKNSIKDALSHTRLLSVIAGGVIIAVLATMTFSEAIYTAVSMLVMLTTATAVSASLKKILGRVGTLLVYIAVASAIAAFSASLTVFFPDIQSYGTVRVMAISAVSGLLLSHLPENEDGIVRSVINSFVSALLFAVMILAVAFVRELCGKGTILGHKVIPFDIHFILTPAGGLIMLSAIAALLNAVFNFHCKRRAANAEKEDMTDDDE